MIDQQQRVVQDSTTRSLLDFAQILIEKIQVQDGTCILHVEDSILTHQYLEEIDLSLLPRHEEIKAIDDTAVKLWNSTTGQRPANMSTQLRCLLQAFAASLLVICQNILNNDDPNLRRTFKYSLKAVESLLNENRVALAEILIEQCAKYCDTLCKLAISLDTNTAASRTKLEHEYILRRLHLAWRKGQQDHADKWFNDLEQHVQSFDKADYHRLVFLLVDIGQASHQAKRSVEAVKWLLRASDLLTAKTSHDPSEEESGLRLHLLQALIKLPITELDTNCEELLKRLLNATDRASIKSMPYQLTRLEYYCQPENLNCSNPKYAATARLQINRSLDAFACQAALSQSTLDTIMHYAYKQFSVAQDQALVTLNKLLMTRLKDENNAEWTEKIIVLVVHFQCIMEKPLRLGDQHDMKELLDQYHEVLGNCISSLGAQACLMDIAKSIKRSEKGPDQSALLQWCEVGLHKIFSALDSENKGRLQRKLMQYWIRQGKRSKFKQIYEEMDLPIRESPESLYLLFQGAMKCGMAKPAREALETLIESPNVNNQLIYACISEAQKHEKPVESILWVTQTILFREGKTLGTPAMYRFALQHIDANEAETNKPVLSKGDQCKRVCEMLNKAAQDMMKANGENAELWDAHELEWFCMTCWNLTLKHMNDWGPFKVSYLAQVTTKFMKRIVEGPASSSFWKKQYLLAIFLDCAFSLICAKEFKNQQDRDKKFQDILAKSDKFLTCYHNTEESLAGADAVETHKKALGVIVFAFEAALITKEWSKAQDLVKYPDEELKWLAGHTYNRAIDHYHSGQNDMWTKYTSLSLKLSQCMADKGFYAELSKQVDATKSD
ncbi:MAG: hypothetical protein GOMPHAMPRED_005458 [Gomphillus americanus]|uniref:Protein ZIP4 homolog n=1 Tax=Gomphillus americanus TaxID=1940652 RepID=A0A8H3FXY9_9LECA|nr:MAG: hypothetical protein GOMPHAMPRED_005458 [Gomphillus americanus]